MRAFASPQCKEWNGRMHATTSFGVFMRIVIGYDGSTSAETAIDDLDRAGLPVDTKARVLSVAEQQIHPVIDAMSEELCNRLQRHFHGWDVQLETPTGAPAGMIFRRAVEWAADLIVVGTHGRSGLSRLMLGSVSNAIARDAACSVRVARARPQREGPLRLLIGHDGSSLADIVVNAVCRRSWPANTEVRILTAIEVLIATRADQMAGIAGTVDEIN